MCTQIRNMLLHNSSDIHITECKLERQYDILRFYIPDADIAVDAILSDAISDIDQDLPSDCFSTMADFQELKKSCYSDEIDDIGTRGIRN